MKILHIFGAVVAVHLAVFLVIFAVPGCRSTGKSTTAGTGSPELGAAPMAAGAPAPFSPAPGETPATANSTVAYQPDMGVRFSPTRPGSPVAAVVQPTASPDVLPASTYVVAKGDSLWSIAHKHGISIAELTAANQLPANAAIRPGQKLMITAKKVPAATATAAASPGESAGPVHVVKSGETLSVIAKRHGTTINTLRRLNNLKSDVVRVGQQLALPDSGAVMPEATAGKAPPPPAARSASTLKHVVKAGETLEAIARLYRVSQREVGIANNIANPSKLRPGQELIIPGKSAGKPASPAAKPEAAPAQEAVAPADPFLPVPSEPEPAIKPTPDVPVIRIEDTPPVAAGDPGRAP